ncbi:MAG: hypothetical protein R3B07_18445 [Polyangiaceae bacterium]
MVPRADVRSDPELAEASEGELRPEDEPRLRAAFDSEPSFPAARLVSDPELTPEEVELTDVPAAVVEIPQLDDFDHGSGVVVIVPWERPMHSFWQRLWNTAKLTTQHGQTFFARFPDGDLVSAARFALTAEAIAVSGLCLIVGPVLWLLVPGLSDVAAEDPVLGSLLLRTIVAGVPTLAIAMALLHGLYGLGLDLAARREGGRGRLGHALRFGLYSAGWDLVTMPLGLIALALSEGVKNAGQVARNTWSLPRTCSQAFLCGIYGLSKESAQRAHRAAMLSTIVGLALGLVACIALAMLR